MNYLITKIKLFVILNRKKVDFTIFVLLYLIFLQPDLDILTDCTQIPVPADDDKGIAACLDAQKLAIEDLKNQTANKPWLTKKAQNIGANLEADSGTATVLRQFSFRMTHFL